MEALFELRGTYKKPFSLVPGIIADALVEEYPEAVETELAQFGAMVQPSIEAPLFITHQFKTSDGKRLVQIGSAGIAVNTLSYGGFDRFRASIVSALEVYFRLAMVEKVSRIGLRYLNRLPQSDANFLSGLTVKLEWPDLPSSNPVALAARMVFAYDDPPGQLAAAISRPSDGATLDLDFQCKIEESFTHGQVLKWIDKAHDRIYEAFTVLVSQSLLDSWK